MSTTHVSAHRKTIWKPALPILAIGLALGLSACGGDTGADNQTPGAQTEPSATATEAPPLATAALADVDGKSVGEATFTKQDGSLQVSVSTDGMKPGFYGLHVHGIAKCEADSAAPDDPADTGAFKSAGGHIPGEEGAKHPDHAGDLPPLLVGADGTATLSIDTDRLEESVLMDADGSSVMIHSQPDNFANIPQRYAADGPDADTTGAGDAGERLACGVVEAKS